MPLNYDALMAVRPAEATQTYTIRETILYALGVGVGQDDALAPETLKYAFEPGLVALPTLACILGAGDAGWMSDPKMGITFETMLHGEQRLRLHRPIPASGTVTSQTTIDAIYDKGAEKGAVMMIASRLTDAATGESLADVGSTIFLRADGGFGGTSDRAPRPPAMPADRPPDLALDLPTRPDQALLYRLSGDTNPLHVDPDLARRVGFDRPILHGLCAYGVVCRAALRLLCDDKPSRLRRFDTRFTSPLYPGETIRTEFWRDGPGRALFRAIALERGVAIQNNGVVEFG